MSHISNLRRSSSKVGSTWNCIKFFEIWAGAQSEPVFGGSATRLKFFKSNSASVPSRIKYFNECNQECCIYILNILNTPFKSNCMVCWSTWLTWLYILTVYVSIFSFQSKQHYWDFINLQIVIFFFLITVFSFFILTNLRHFLDSWYFNPHFILL